jgi:hypothetical protein
MKRLHQEHKLLTLRYVIAQLSSTPSSHMNVHQDATLRRRFAYQSQQLENLLPAVIDLHLAFRDAKYSRRKALAALPHVRLTNK